MLMEAGAAADGMFEQAIGKKPDKFAAKPWCRSIEMFDCNSMAANSVTAKLDTVPWVGQGSGSE